MQNVHISQHRSWPETTVKLDFLLGSIFTSFYVNGAQVHKMALRRCIGPNEMQSLWSELEHLWATTLHVRHRPESTECLASGDFLNTHEKRVIYIFKRWTLKHRSNSRDRRSLKPLNASQLSVCSSCPPQVGFCYHDSKSESRPFSL